MTTRPGPSQTSGFGHVGFQVSDLERSRAYYRDIIGLVEVQRMTREEPYLSQVTGYEGVRLEIALLAERSSGVILELVEYPAELGHPIDPATANPGTGHICFIVDDVDAIHARATAAGHGSVNPPVTPTAGRWIGGRSVYLLDPDGIRVELVQLGTASGEAADRVGDVAVSSHAGGWLTHGGQARVPASGQVARAPAPPSTMSLGLAGGPLPLTSGELTSELACWLEERGVRAVALHLEDHDVLIEGGGAERVRQTLAEHGIGVSQSTGNRPNLVDADAGVRADALARVRRAIAVARQLGAVMVNTGVGSHHPSFPYGPHPANHAPQAMDTLVANLRILCPEVADQGLLLSLEPHVMTTIGDVETISAVVEAVGHPGLRVNFDPVNLLGTLPAVYDSAAAIGAIGDRLGPVLAPSAHIKDIRPAPALVLHLDEVPPGDGFVDWEAFFAVCRRLGDGSALIVEHLQGHEVEDALVRVTRMASAHGIALA